MRKVRQSLLLSLVVMAIMACVSACEQTSQYKTMRVNVNINEETFYRDVEFVTPCTEGEWSEGSIDVTSALTQGPGCRVFLVIRRSDCGAEEWGVVEEVEVGDCFELPPPYTLEPVKNTGWQDSPIGNDPECFMQGTEGFCRELQE
jgi:hypothetical protein